MTMRDPLPGDRNLSPPIGYTKDEWEQKVNNEYGWYFAACIVALIILINVML